MYISEATNEHFQIVLLHDINRIRKLKGMPLIHVEGNTKPDLREIKEIHDKYWKNVIRIPGKSVGVKRKSSHSTHVMPLYDNNDNVEQIPKKPAQNQRDKNNFSTKPVYEIIHGTKRKTHSTQYFYKKQVNCKPSDGYDKADFSFTGYPIYIQSDNSWYEIGRSILWKVYAHTCSQQISACLQMKEKNTINTTTECELYSKRSDDEYKNKILEKWIPLIKKIDNENPTVDDLEIINVFRTTRITLEHFRINCVTYKNDAITLLNDGKIPYGCLQEICNDRLILGEHNPSKERIEIKKFPRNFDKRILDPTSTIQIWIICQNSGLTTNAVEIPDNKTRLNIATAWEYYSKHFTLDGLQTGTMNECLMTSDIQK